MVRPAGQGRDHRRRRDRHPGLRQLRRGHPSSPSDRIQFQGHAAPQPGAALILVAIAGLALLWRRRAPVAVLVVSVAAASVYSLLGLVNGAILIAPILALYSVASQVSLRRAF